MQRQILGTVMSFIIKLIKMLPGSVGQKVVQLLYGSKQGSSEQLREFYRDKYNVSIGKYTYGGCFSKNFNVGGEVEIGRYCSIAANVHYFGANHPMEMVSTSAYFYNKAFSRFEVRDIPRSKLVIGNDVWIGYGAIITCGCKSIGSGSVIGAGSIVTHDVPPYTVVTGNPARILRKRHSDEASMILQELKWWEYDPDFLMKLYPYMNNPITFSENFKKMSSEIERDSI